MTDFFFPHHYSSAQALEIIPYTLAENAGINPISMVTELRNRHNLGDFAGGINVRNGTISDMWAEKIVQPLLVNTSEIQLATECVGMILKIGTIYFIRVCLFVCLLPVLSVLKIARSSVILVLSLWQNRCSNISPQCFYDVLSRRLDPCAINACTAAGGSGDVR